MQTTINNCRLSSFRLSGAAVFWTLTNSKQTNTDSARILDELIKKIPVFPFSGGVFDIDQQTNTDSARILDDLIKKIPLKEVKNVFHGGAHVWAPEALDVNLKYNLFKEIKEFNNSF